jgi:cytochrome c-type biogenesis protein CcmH/NrfG
VLALDPAHYGANYQLAKALDQIGQRDAARAQWEMVLKMALAINDEQVAATARKRLSP